MLDGQTRVTLGQPESELFIHPLMAGGPQHLVGLMKLDRAGDFILRISATDKTTARTAVREVPFHVEASWPAGAPR